MTGCIHSDHIVSRSCCKVDVVVTCTGTHHNLQLLSSVKHLGIHLIRADNHGIDILHSIEQLALLCVFLEHDYFVACCIKNFLNTFHGHAAKGFLCCYKYFHNYEL